MINKQQRKQLSEIIRHLGSGTISFKDFKRKRYEIFGNDADFDDLEFNDENIHDITAITLSCEALYLCELLKKKGMWERWFKSELKQGYDLRKKISLICLFLYSDLDLYCFDKAIKMSPPYYKYGSFSF